MSLTTFKIFFNKYCWIWICSKQCHSLIHLWLQKNMYNLKTMRKQSDGRSLTYQSVWALKFKQEAAAIFKNWKGDAISRILNLCHEFLSFSDLSLSSNTGILLLFCPGALSDRVKSKHKQNWYADDSGCSSRLCQGGKKDVQRSKSYCCNRTKFLGGFIGGLSDFTEWMEKKVEI